MICCENWKNFAASLCFCFYAKQRFSLQLVSRSINILFCSSCFLPSELETTLEWKRLGNDRLLLPLRGFQFARLPRRRRCRHWWWRQRRRRKPWWRQPPDFFNLNSGIGWRFNFCPHTLLIWAQSTWFYYNFKRQNLAQMTAGSFQQTSANFSFWTEGQLAISRTSSATYKLIESYS